MGNLKKNSSNKFIILTVAIVGILLTGAELLYSSFALVEPVKSISFISENLNYDEKEPGSWKVDKSAKWIDRGKARITIDVDTILKDKEEGTDLILVLDTSESMRGEKLEKEKEASIKLIEKFLLNPNNRITLIEYNNSSEVLLDSTNDKGNLINKINDLEPKGGFYYYNAISGINKFLNNYNENNDRNCEALIVESSYYNNKHLITTSENYYKTLKISYPGITIHTVQYEQGNEVFELIKRVSDIQYVANVDTLEKVLLNIPINSTTYDEFTLTEYIDTDNFYIESTSDIKVNEGIFSLNTEEQKITWTMDSLKSGKKTRITIDVKLKEELLEVGGTYSTDKEMNLHTKLEKNIEDVINNDTPIIKDNYQVIYEVNAPEGCSVSNIPENRNKFVFDKVDISTEMTCSGYQFRGWSLITEGVNQINDDYFIMPESDVLLRGEWTSLKITKSMDGEIYEGPLSMMQARYDKVYDFDWSISVPDTKFWEYKDSITKIVFQNKMNSIEGAIADWDISEEEDSSVMAHLVPNTNDTSTYTVYIQGNSGITANENCCYLFYNFTKLESIEGLEYFNTSNVKYMQCMFWNCENLTNLDLSHFDTSNIVNMASMFLSCRSLTNLNLSNFNTSNVVDMSYMFDACSNIKNLNVSHFDTKNVLNMSAMFSACQNLLGLDVSSFNTTQVVDMQYMFYYCLNLRSLNLENFNTPQVTNMSRMFYECQSLNSLNINNFDTSNVTNMEGMFCNCYNLVSLNIKSFDTSKVVNMAWMFHFCYKLQNLDLQQFSFSKVTDINRMFVGCYVLTTTINIDSTTITDYTSIFENTAIRGGQVVVNYTSSTSSLVDRMLATKTSNGTTGTYSNVVKGTIIQNS